ncbi:uncharacterized protein LOC124393309 isoform X1 [Silurus meridionalis]|uniref:uncharacterized protein LOC124393309 isoform X1 n=1 Tax=Silurus meridionalis TaxID=175797 RepID=UPI001EEA0F8D|nr:uncharacterized protein LOC124393309 isoform X1 [Silurus meridionalis]
MPRGDFFIVMLLLWTLIGRGADGERVTGVLHGRVELHGRYGQSPDVDKVEWAKYPPDNSTRKLLFLVFKPNITTCMDPCRHIDFNLQNMSLILVNLTLEDEGTYEEKTTLKNNTVIYFNFTLSLLDGSNTTISSTPGSLTTSKVQVTVTEVYLNSTSSPFFDHLKHPVFLAGSSLAGLLVLCFIFIYICKRSRRRNMKPPSTEEAIYNEVTFVQEEAIPLSVNPLVVVYQDFIKPKDSHQFEQSEDFGYSTIPDVLERIQLSQPT